MATVKIIVTGKLVLSFILTLNTRVLVASEEKPAGTDFWREESVRDYSKKV